MDTDPLKLTEDFDFFWHLSLVFGLEVENVWIRGIGLASIRNVSTCKHGVDCAK